MALKNPLEDIPTIELDYNILLSALSGTKFPRNAIGHLLKTGKLTRVKKGIYTKTGEGLSLPVLANQISGPSYVSQQYALSLHALIPERVPTVTSMTIGKKRQFETPVGTFTYEPLPERLFSIGVRRVEITFTQAFLVAVPEKAVIDCIWKRKDLRSPKQLEEYLVDDQRIDLDMRHTFSLSRMRKIARTYNLEIVNFFQKLLEQRTVK